MASFRGLYLSRKMSYTTDVHAILEHAQDDLIDELDPLRHLRKDVIAEVDNFTPDSTSFDHSLSPPTVAAGSQSQKSRSELLSILPYQHFSEQDGVLQLAFDEEKKQDLSIKLVVDAAPGCGGIAWPAGQILSSYLVHVYRPNGDRSLSGKTIVELGSGTGLVGLVAAKLDASCKVWITDQAPLFNIMRTNVDLNELASNVHVAELNWGAPLPDFGNFPKKPDIILAADCVYFEPAFPLLVHTLSELATPDTEVLFCYKKRRKADKRFFSLLKKKFTWKEVEDDPNRELYNREAISLLRLVKIPEKK